MLFDSDHVGSDDMEAILEFSANHAAGTSGSRPLDKENNMNGDNFSRIQELNGRINRLDTEVKEIDEQISQLKELRSKVLSERQIILEKINGLRRHPNANSSSPPVGNKGGIHTFKSTGEVNYMDGIFEWSGALKARMREVFSIPDFRLCQEGVCNANMDGRDIVCVMPTGGGKSLTYQLPALLNPGCTLVISPLIALITDQIFHLREFGIEAVMLTGSTTKEESRSIFSRLTMTTGARGRASSSSHGAEIKLLYVTPEKIVKSKTFTSMLEKLANAGKLARIVIDEAHCVSQLGHDFRPDYKKLSILRQLFPRVPILALSATCPPKVLKDLLLTLRMKPVVNSTAAGTEGTVYFSSPLYRKNLHYKVVQKPSSATAVIKEMAEYIIANHRNDSGIVYCLSKKDTETVAQGLYEESGHIIRTGVYHADVHDREKESLHRRWRSGEIKVVCATIAFGLGIDKGDVRFVLHHSISKSLEGYYQESGRAGRDGKDSDCILYYRPQDASRLSALVCGELEGQLKLQDMLRFAMDVQECRKLQFARYFSSSASLSMSAWGTAETDAHARCGHCDNCVRSPVSIERRDVSLVAWQILQVLRTIENDGGRVTLGMLADLVRGAGGGSYGVSSGNRRKGKQSVSKEKVELNLEEVAGGKVTLGKDDTETLLVHLLLTEHIKETFHSTAYSINVYLSPGLNALRLTRYTREAIEAGNGPQIEVTFLKKSKTSTRKRNRTEANTNEALDNFFDASGSKKQKVEGRETGEDSDDVIVGDNDEDKMSLYVDSEEDEKLHVARNIKGQTKGRTSKGTTNGSRRAVIMDSEDEYEDWTFTMTTPKPKGPEPEGIGKRSSANGGSSKIKLSKRKLPAENMDDVIEISDSD